MTANSEDAATSEPQIIFDAGVVILIDRTPPKPRIMFGRRRPDNVFLPDKWVFPGGRFDADDLKVSACDALDTKDHACLMWGVPLGWTPQHATTLALTAVREVFEETGLVIGTQGIIPAPVPEAWRAFSALGFTPQISGLRVLARAITPPGRTRRYDTRFFLADASVITANSGRDDGEFTEKGWFTFDECRALDLPYITRLILEDAVQSFENPHSTQQNGVPFYYQDSTGYRRDLIAPKSGASPP